jgi:Integrase core domain
MEMGVEQRSKRDVAARLCGRYLAADREEKGRLLDEFVALTDYHRKYAMALLRHGPSQGSLGGRGGGHPLVYGPAVVAALRVAAEATGWICGKRLSPFLEELVPALEREGALRLSAEVRTALLGISAATIDRRLKMARIGEKPRGLCTTKPGSLLRKQVPVRTFTPWDEQRPGFVEIDLVAHCGNSTAGSYLCTLDMVDLATGWTECAAVMDKSRKVVFAALEQLRARLPFPLLGIDSDNGSEFLNEQLVRWCRKEGISFTRCRAYHKNDQAHVEQKNWSVVRQLIGYDRYESTAALAQMRLVYELVRLEVNGFLPVMKLIGKERVGAKVRKKYDVPRTPYRRAVAAGAIQEEAKACFEGLMGQSGPLALRGRLEAELDRLWTLRVGNRAQVATG